MGEDTSNLTERNVIRVADESGRKNLAEPDEKEFNVKLYKRRWLMLFLFILYAGSTNGQWLAYSIIDNIIARYYDVSLVAVHCTAMSFMYFYVICIFPVAFLADRMSLKFTIVLGCLLSCLGAWIKTLSVAPDRFYLLMIGQSSVASTQVLMLPLPGRLASKWFGSKELSTATSLGIFGIQVGVSISFLLPPVFIKNHENLAEIGSDLNFFSWIIAISTTVMLVLVILLFQDEPKLPPSKTRAIQRNQKQSQDEGMLVPVKRLFRNRSYLMLCNAFGLVIGVLNSVSTLLNQIYSVHFKNGEKTAGIIGILIVFAGMAGSVVAGLVLDKTRKFKATAIIDIVLCMAAILFFGCALHFENNASIFLAASVLGFFVCGFLTIGYELAIEYTYPENENLSAGILNISNNVYGVIFVLILGKILENYGDTLVHISYMVILTTALVTVVLTKDVHRRQDAKNAVVYEACNIGANACNNNEVAPETM